MMHPLTRYLMLACIALAIRPAAAGLPPEFMPSSEVRPGMVGEGRTVFHGFEVESFKVEILGVERNALPGSNLIIARLEGPMLEQHGVVAGMSGSPVFIDGRLIGAVAYGWSFAYHPICGITPIESMWTVWENIGRPGVSKGPPPDTSRIAGLAGWDFERDWEAFNSLLEGRGQVEPLSLRPRLPALAGLQGHLRPLWTPLMVSGATPRVEERLRGFFSARGHELVSAAPIGSSAGGGPGDQEAPPIEAGSALGVPLMTGDMTLSAVGTVTWCDGDRLIGFGHPMFFEGASATPMSQAWIIGFMQSYSLGFKLAEVREPIGMIDQDRLFAVGGRIGATPPTTPLSVRIQGEAAGIEREYHFQCWKNADYLPLLALVAVEQAYSGAVAERGEMTLEAHYEIRLTDGHVIRKRHFTSALAGVIAPTLRSLMFDLFLLLDNPFHEADIASIDVTLEARHGNLRQQSLTGLTTSHARYEPGDMVRMEARLQPWRGPEQVRAIDLELPAALTPGTYIIHLADAAGAQMVERRHAPGPFTPRQYEDILDLLEVNSAPADELRLYLFEPATDLVLRGRSLAGMPSSMERVMRGSAPAQLQQESVGRRIAQHILNMDAPTYGSAMAMIEVVRHINK